jgi:hypothetical protein
LRKPACIAAVMGRARAEQYAVLCEICDILRGDHSIKIIAGFEDEAIWNAAIAATRRVRHLSEFDPYTLDRASRPRAVGEACGRLEKRGFTIMALVSTPGPSTLFAPASSGVSGSSAAGR